MKEIYKAKLKGKKATGVNTLLKRQSRLTVEVNAAYVLEQLFASRVLHLGADPRVVGTEVLVHVVERVRHGVHRIDHKLDLPLLLVVGVFANPLLSCTSKTNTHTHIHTHRRTVRNSIFLISKTKESSRSTLQELYVLANTIKHFEFWFY